MREYVHQTIIPGLPDDLALRCLAKLSHGYHGLLESVSKRWRDVIRSSDYSNYKASKGWCGNWLFVLSEGSNNQWVSYDPEADKWHPLPKIPRDCDLQHHGFSCVGVNNRFLVIGGSYAPQDPVFIHQSQRPLITNDVMQFDPFRKRWRRMASMITPRSHFACCVICSKVYVAGGRSVSSATGLALAEVYDPVKDKWEELPPMPTPQLDCLGLSYKGKLHVLSNHVGLPDQKTEVFNLSDGSWNTVNDIWPFSRAMHFSVQIMEDDRLYTVVDWGESSVKTRDNERGDWCDIGSVPAVVLPDHSRPLEAFGYGVTALRQELYVLGGQVLKWEDSGTGRFQILKLGLVRVCNPSVTPLKWREAKPMCRSAYGSVLGCSSMEEDFSA